MEIPRRKPTPEQLAVLRGLGSATEKFPLVGAGYDASMVHNLPYDIGGPGYTIVGGYSPAFAKSAYGKFVKDLSPQIPAGSQAAILLGLKGQKDPLAYKWDTPAHEFRHVGFNKLRAAGYSLPGIQAGDVPLGEEDLVRLLGHATGTEDPETVHGWFDRKGLDADSLLKQKALLYGLMQLQQAGEQVSGQSSLNHYPSDLQPLQNR